MRATFDIPFRLALNRVRGIGPATWQRLREQVGPPERWRVSGAQVRASLSDSQWQALMPVLQTATPAHLPGVEEDLNWLTERGHHVLFSDDADYPPLLAAIHQPPPVLFVRGDKGCLLRPQLAVVGTRHPSRGALVECRDICIDLVRRGVIITSGLALGIDAASHAAALEAGGTTIAVLAHGLDSVYPPRHRELAARIERCGALVSEFPVGTPPRPESFPRRNRLISGLSQGVWVVEGALQSGSMITAREALEQGREVFALPGSVRNPLTRGCHRLIRQGAVLVETADDILAELRWPGAIVPAASGAIMPRVSHPDAGLEAVLAVLEQGDASVDELVATLEVDAARINARLCLLMLEGVVSSDAGRFVLAGRPL